MSTSIKEVNHTPGPWVVYELANDGDAYGNIAGMPIVTTEDLDTEICGACFNPADARIIASAPELLEACKALLSLVPRNKLHPFGYTDSPQDKANDIARAAIAKAQGRQ